MARVEIIHLFLCILPKYTQKSAPERRFGLGGCDLCSVRSTEIYPKMLRFRPYRYAEALRTARIHPRMQEARSHTLVFHIFSFL